MHSVARIWHLRNLSEVFIDLIYSQRVCVITESIQFALIKMTVPVNIEPEPNARCNKSISAYNHWKYFKYYKRIFMAEVWIGTFIFCFVTIGLYLTMTSGL